MNITYINQNCTNYASYSKKINVLLIERCTIKKVETLLYYDTTIAHLQNALLVCEIKLLSIGKCAPLNPNILPVKTIYSLAADIVGKEQKPNTLIL